MKKADNFDLKHFLIENRKITRNSRSLNEAYVDNQGNFIVEDNIVVVIKNDKRKFYLKDNIDLEKYFYFKGEISKWNSKNYAAQLNKQILEVYKQSAMYTYHKKLKTPIKNLINPQFTPVKDHPIEEDFFTTDITISPNLKIDKISIHGDVGPSLYSGKENWGLELITGLLGQIKDDNLNFDKDNTDELEDLEFRLNNSIIYFIPSLDCNFPSYYLDTNNEDDYDRTSNKTKFNTKKQLLDIFNTVGLEALNGHTFEKSFNSTINLKETKYNLYKVKINSTFTNDSDLTQYFAINGKETGESYERAIKFNYLILIPKEYSLKNFIEYKFIQLRIMGVSPRGVSVTFAENVPLKTLIYGEGNKKFKEKENGEVKFSNGGFNFTINYKQPNVEQVFEIPKPTFDVLKRSPIIPIS